MKGKAMNNEINVEEIMAEIRKDIEERGLKEEKLSFEDIPISQKMKNGGIGKASLKDKILHYTYFGIFINTPQGFQNFVKKLFRR